MAVDVRLKNHHALVDGDSVVVCRPATITDVLPVTVVMLP